MATQNEKEKWQELADVLGWQVREANGQIAVLESETEIFQVVNGAFRDEIMHSLQLAKQRTPLELAAEEMAAILKEVHQNIVYKSATWQRIQELLQKAGVMA